MSFRCQKCGNQVPPKTVQKKLVVERYDSGQIRKELSLCSDCHKVVKVAEVEDEVIRPSRKSLTQLAEKYQ